MLYPEILAALLALEFRHQLLELWQPAVAVFEVIAEAGELTNVVVVELQEGALLRMRCPGTMSCDAIASRNCVFGDNHSPGTTFCVVRGQCFAYAEK